MRAIQTVNLTKRFGDRVAVDGLNLEVEDGSIFALLGMNGAGKTTTIRILCNLIVADDGQALVFGEDVNKNPEKVKPIINVSPQETAISPVLTVRENLEFIARIYGADKNGAKISANDMLEKFSLKDRANDKAKTLSGGMQRRLSIAMALISNPKLVFLDEPTLGLDVVSRRELWHFIKELKSNTTVVLTTHYLEEAEALSDQIGIMKDGKLMAVGTAEELKRQTAKDNFEDAFLSICGVDYEK